MTCHNIKKKDLQILYVTSHRTKNDSESDTNEETIKNLNFQERNCPDYTKALTLLWNDINSTTGDNIYSKTHEFAVLFRDIDSNSGRYNVIENIVITIRDFSFIGNSIDSNTKSADDIDSNTRIYIITRDVIYN